MNSKTLNYNKSMMKIKNKSFKNIFLLVNKNSSYEVN